MKIIPRILSRCELSTPVLWIIVMADIAMSVILGADWGEWEFITWNHTVPRFWYRLFTDIAFGYTVIFCLATGLLYMKLCRDNGDTPTTTLTTAQNRWLLFGVLLSLFSGLAPVIALDKYHLFIPGLYGFFLPLILLLIMFGIDSCYVRCRPGRRQLFCITVVLFTCNIVITLAVRLIMFLWHH